MTLYIHAITKEYPRHAGDLEALGWSVGTSLPENWEEVEPTEAPILQEHEVCFEVTPVKENGVWKMQWEKKALTTQEILDLEVIQTKAREMTNG